MNKNFRQLNVFISYSHKNMKYKEKLLTSLEALKQSYNIAPWHDGMIDAGGNIDDNVKKALDKSQIVLLIVTDNFIASHYCMKIELEKAIEREKQGKCIVIPVMFQESVLTDVLSFFGHNRVPEDGKPISTSFKNQNLGCTHAVNMIRNMIDCQFPNSKKGASKSQPKVTPTKSPAIKSVNNINSKLKNVYMELYKNGKLSQIQVTQNMIDLIPKYFSSINNFRTIMDQSLISAKKRYSQLCKKYKGKTIPNKEKLELLRLYLMDICAYTKMYITENTGIKVHFRISKNDFYLGFIASTEDNDSDDLASDWTTKMTPIKMYEGLIYHSSKLRAPLLKTLNPKLNAKGKNDDIWKDYVTFTFPKFHSGQTPLISYCISVHKDYYKVKGDMLKILAYLNFGNVIEKYISDYSDICINMDKYFSLEDIINAL